MSDTTTGYDVQQNGITDIITDMTTFVAGLRQQMKRNYDRGVNRDLSRQNSQDLLKRNITSVLQTVYSESLTRLTALARVKHESQINGEFSPSAIGVLRPYDGIVEELLQYALKKHNTSCALSNFPDEHRPGKAYITEVIEVAAKDWERFAVQVNDILTLPDKVNI